MVCIRSKWLTVFAASLSISATGFAVYWGNLFIYYASYVHYAFDTHSELAGPWILPLCFAANPVGAFFAGRIANRIGKRATLFCGIALHNFGMLMVYFVIGKSTVLLNIFLGVVQGLGIGSTQVILTQYALDWADKRSGYIIALLRASTVLAGVIVNHLVTLYINPSNKTPDLLVGPQRMFSQDDVLQRIPNVFLIIGCSCLSIEMICLLLVNERKKSPIPSIASDQTQLVESGKVADSKDSQVTSFSPHNSSSSISNYQNDNLADGQVNPESTDATPRDLIRRKEFYVLSFTITCACMSFLNTLNYYKAYGQIHIHDDHFLTKVADVQLVVKVFVALLWGVFFDRFGVKMGLILYFASISLFNIFFCFAPLVNKWLYGIATILLLSITTYMNLVYSCCCAKAFGNKHFSKNYGMITVSSVVVYLVAPLILQTILEMMGWFYIFLLVASLGIVALIIIMLVLDNK